jgi:hypothetical protein
MIYNLMNCFGPGKFVVLRFQMLIVFGQHGNLFLKYSYFGFTLIPCDGAESFVSAMMCPSGLGSSDVFVLSPEGCV